MADDQITDQITDLAAEDQAQLREKYRQEMVELADKFCQERGYVPHERRYDDR